MLKPGMIGRLPVSRLEVVGAILQNGEQEIMLPMMDCPEGLAIGDEIEVFIYPTMEGNIEATTKKPILSLGEVRLLKMKNVIPTGAFADIGLMIDLFVPSAGQRVDIQEGKSYLISMQYDEERNKLLGTTRLALYYKFRPRGFNKGQQVEIILTDKEDTGMKVIADQKSIAFLPYNETMRHVRLGETYKAWVRRIDDKEMVVSLLEEGSEKPDKAAVKVLDYVTHNGGYARLNRNTGIEEVELRLHMSKKTFLQAIDYLEKRNELIVTKRGIKIPKSDETSESQSEK